MSTLPKSRLTPEQYLEMEEAAEYKSEYYQGEIFAMSGATYAHNTIAGNTYYNLRTQLHGRCSLSNSGMRIHIPRTGLYIRGPRGNLRRAQVSGSEADDIAQPNGNCRDSLG
jgi:Uma2 family endonuclease